MITRDTFSRIDKAWVDTGASIEGAQRRRRSMPVHATCGEEIAESASLQAALLTAVATASRCFPDSVTVSDIDTLARASSPFSATRSLRDELVILGIGLTPEKPSFRGRRLLFGSVPAEDGDLQVTFDGWIAGVGPAELPFRLPERERSSLAGVLAGAQAIAELFFLLAGMHPEAAGRVVTRSLWRPDLDPSDREALGPCLEHLPTEYWVSGLGHLGQAFVWTIGLLPFESRRDVKIVLNDFDVVVRANVETGLLTRARNVGRLKTRIVAGWLEEKGFATGLVERAFDDRFSRQDPEPRLALFGFDGSGPRWLIESAGFAHVIDCGIGGTADSFDTIATHTFPHPTLTALSLWPEHDAQDRVDRARRLAHSSRFYQEFARAHGCGEVELAGTAVAVPFVGAAAASLVLAEAVRAVNGGIRLGSSVTRLATPSGDVRRPIAGGYDSLNAPLILTQRARPSLVSA